MIKSLTIKNFQSHKDTEINFSDGVNMLIGPSDSGKSAVLRALRWVLRNEPLGDYFRSDWGGDTSVKVVFDDGNEVTRVKTNSTNTYILNKAEFSAFKGTIPEEVAKVINMQPVNFQFQLDAPYLLSNTSGEVANHFNKIANLQEIDESIKRANKGLNEQKKQLDYYQRSTQDIQQELEGLNYLHKFEAEVEVLEQMQNHYNSYSLKITTISNKIKTIKNLNEQLVQHEELLELEKFVVKALELYNQLRLLSAKKSKLNNLLDTMQTIELEVDRISLLVNKAPYVDAALGRFKDLKVLQEHYLSLQKMVDRFAKVQRLFDSASKRVINYEAEFNKVFPEICPLCGTPKTMNHATH